MYGAWCGAYGGVGEVGVERLLSRRAGARSALPVLSAFCLALMYVRGCRLFLCFFNGIVRRLAGKLYGAGRGGMDMDGRDGRIVVGVYIEHRTTRPSRMPGI